MSVFFTSDLHLGHKNILSYTKRPFTSVSEMDEALITNWNALVQPNDDIYVVGDFSFHNEQKTNEIIDRLQGHKHLILGNHDKSLKASSKAKFVTVSDLKEIKVPDLDVPNGNQYITLCHYAMRVWNRSCYKSFMLHGHSHGMLDDIPTSLSTDVGVDVWDCKPVSYIQIKQFMAARTFVPVACGDKTERNSE